MHNFMSQFPLFFSLAIKTCKILYLDVIIKDVVVVVAFPCLPNMTTIHGFNHSGAEGTKVIDIHVMYTYRDRAFTGKAR